VVVSYTFSRYVLCKKLLANVTVNTFCLSWKKNNNKSI